MRIVLITGKGGVGRSTLTAALAKLAGRAGKRVLVAEIGEPGEDYSPLARHFGRDRLPLRPRTPPPQRSRTPYNPDDTPLSLAFSTAR